MSNKTYFKDVYGCTASIQTNRTSGKCVLRIRDAHGGLFHKKEYSSYRSARVALGRLTDGLMEQC